MKPTELAGASVLPHCLSRSGRGALFSKGMEMVPVYCGNCGVQARFVVGKDHTTFAAWLCTDEYPKNCEAKWGHLFGTYAVPDEIFFERVTQAQLEHDGRLLTVPEILEALASPDHYLSKLDKDRPLFTAR